MALRGEIKLGIRLLEDEYEDWVDKYGPRDSGVWLYSKGIAQICNNHVSRLIEDNKVEAA